MSTTPVQQQQASPQQQNFNPRELAKALKEAGIGGQPQQQPAMSQADMDKAMKKFVVTPQLLNALRGDDLNAAAAALQQIVDGAAVHAITVSGHLTQHHLGNFRQEVEPQLGLVGELYQGHLFNQFEGRYPELKAHRGVVETTLKALSTSDQQPETTDALFELLAKQSESTIKAINPQFALSAPNQPGTAPGATGGAPVVMNTNPTPTSMPTGGQGGGVGQRTAPPSDGQDIFDDA